ncbi:MAG: hypothetical protein E7381_02035 [Clostridiales bacterium]|nr:hypothetical protein [Clostridiales bacterium]
MTTKKRSILLSILTLMLCLALVAVGTYALFSDQVTLENHLQAGTLDVTLTRTSLKTKTLDDTTGFLVDNPVNDEDVDFSKPTTRNVFDLETGDLIVPQSSYLAEMKIENNSDVAFKYWIEVVLKDSTDPAFAEQLDVKVTTEKMPQGTSATLSAGLKVGSEQTPIGTLAKGTSQTFTISVTFVDDNNVNNDAMNDELNFDIVVHAVQETEDPNA